MSFSELGLTDSLCRAVARLDYAQPTPVQLAAIPVVLAGPATAVRAVPSSEIKARADASGASPSGSLVPVKVEIPAGHAGVTVQRVEPAEIRLRPAPRRRS